MKKTLVGAWALLTAIALPLSACSKDPEPTPAPSSTTTTASSTTAASSAAQTSTSMAEPTSSAPSATTSAQGKPSSGKDSGKESGKNREDENIAKVRKKFGSLAPDELFDKFDSCAPNGVQDSMACSGDGVGQFQFFASDAKAASTTQLLTELRSSRVVEDTGRKVVGWSTLGNTAIITVVDNDLGLVMQQMVSTEEADPAKRIRELGLVDSESASDSEESEGDEGAEEDKEAEEPSKN